MFTYQQAQMFQNFLSVQSGAYLTSPDPAEQAENQKAAVDTVDRVRRYTRYATGIARNQTIVDRVVESANKAMKSEKLEAYQKAHQALVAEKLEPEELGKRSAALRAEHDADALVAELNRRHAELMASEVLADDGVSPLKLYRILVTDLPGWNDAPETPYEDRGGLVSPADIKFLFSIGVLYDPSDAEPEKPSGPAN
ncbi:MAG: hypothetical protein PHX83_06785 [Acidobacteriia bacterium]|nr:hypothetical protein [Terriglobia bacterium]